eukprot:evm.model.scf_75.7 EVM.evm.TU.scf_75.7   scf_75:52989-57126(-)
MAASAACQSLDLGAPQHVGHDTGGCHGAGDPKASAGLAAAADGIKSLGAEGVVGRRGEAPTGDMENVPPAKVASRFMQYFYDVMNNHTEYLYQFYRDESCLMVQEIAEEGCPWTVNAEGQEDIRHALETLYKDVTIHIEAHSAQRSVKGSVLLLVTGRMRRQDCSEERLFNQAFLLARQPDGFYVHTDNIIVHGATTSSLFFSMREKAEEAGGKEVEDKNEEADPIVAPASPELPQGQPSAAAPSPDAYQAAPREPCQDEPAGPAAAREASPDILPDPLPPNGKENGLAKPSYMEALLKASAQRQALRQLQQRPGGDPGVDERSPPPKADDGASEARSASAEPGPNDDRPNRRRHDDEDRGWAGRNGFKRRGGSPRGRVPNGERGERGEREGRGWQRRGNGGLDRSGQEEAQPGARPGPRAPPGAQAKGRPRSTKVREAERRDLVSRRIFVAKLPLGVRREAVEEAFGAFGDVESVVVRGGERVAFAFITYRSEEAACGALEQGEVVVDGQPAVARRWIDNQPKERNGKVVGKV